MLNDTYTLEKSLDENLQGHTFHKKSDMRKSEWMKIVPI